MPDLLSGYTEALDDDLATVRWPDADAVRTRGRQRRRRTQVGLVALTVGLVAAVAATAAVRPAGRPIPREPLASPAQAAPTPGCPSIGCIRWTAALLGPDDVGYSMAMTGISAAPLTSSRLGSCPDSAPLGSGYGDATGVRMLRPGGGQFDESITAYQPGHAATAITEDLAQRLAGPCHGSYEQVGTDSGGRPTAVLRDRTAPLPAYEVFLAQDGFLIWLRVQLPITGVDLAAVALDLGVKAAARLHCQVSTPGAC
jgi:hypothetical protein